MNTTEIAERLSHIEHPHFGYARDLVSFAVAVKSSLSHLKGEAHYIFGGIFSWENDRFEKYVRLVTETQKGRTNNVYPNEHGWYITKCYIGVGRKKHFSLYDIRLLGLHNSGCFWLLDHTHLPDLLKSEMGRAIYTAWKQQIVLKGN
jgi:hypothetical protein